MANLFVVNEFPMLFTSDLKFNPIGVESWAAFQPEIAIKEGIEYLRKKSSEIIYKAKIGGFECLKCGSEILAARVAHPIYDGPFPRSGSGQFYYEPVPYCPNCEKEPNSSGSPIIIGIKFSG
jgi:hypothetical protein